MPATTTQHYDDGIHRFDYTLHRKPRLKHRYIRIREGEVIVSSSIHTPPQTIHDFIADKADWICKHLNEHHHNVGYDLTRPDALIYRYGVPHKLSIIHGQKNHIIFENRIAHVTLDTHPTHDTIVALLHQHRKENAPTVILPRVEHWSRIMDLHPAGVSFRRARTRWGSCSSRNTISLNTHLLMLPFSLIDYVIVHELAHICHKNHSKSFWELIEKHLPKWQKMRKSIRKYEKFLT